MLTLTTTVDQLISNKAVAQLRAIFEQATKPLRTWFANNSQIAAEPQPVQRALLNEIETVGHAGHLRAAVNRRGAGDNFSYWFGLGFGARREAFARSTKQLIELKGHIKTALNDADLADAHPFLNHFHAQVEEATKEYFIEIHQIGQSAFADQLREDDAYWRQCQQRWGMGPGFKHDIRGWTKEWFAGESRLARHEFLEREIQRRWQALMNRLAQQLETVDGKQRIPV